MALLSKEQILSKSHGYETAKVPAPEWGGEVLVRELTVPEVTRIGLGAVDPETGELNREAVDLETILEVMPQIAAWAVVDKNGNSILSLEEVLAMKGRHFNVIQDIAIKALELTGLVEEVAFPNA